MNKYLIKLANHLDKKGLHKEADYVDWILKNASDNYQDKTARRFVINKINSETRKYGFVFKFISSKKYYDYPGDDFTKEMDRKMKEEKYKNMTTEEKNEYEKRYADSETGTKKRYYLYKTVLLVDPAVFKSGQFHDHDKEEEFWKNGLAVVKNILQNNFEKGLIDEEGYGTWKNATHGFFKYTILEADLDPIDYDGPLSGLSIEIVARGKDE